MSHGDAAVLLMELEAMRAARVQDAALCRRLSEDNAALVRDRDRLADRLCAANADVGRLSTELEALRTKFGVAR